jgi:diguanylate cyclase
MAIKPAREQEDFKAALDMARLALDLLQRYLIPPTPHRFAVAYHYFTAEKPDLIKVIDRLVSFDKLNGQTADEVYDQFFGRRVEEAELHEASKKIETTVSQVVEYIDTAAGEAEHYGTVLAGFTDKAAKPGGDLQSAVSTVLNETKAMAQSNRGLEERLQASSREIVALRQHLERLEREATTDALTQIANRKRFDVALRECIAVALKTQTQLSLLMVDIDFFKKFNDTYGHLLGDQVLRLVARYLTDCIKGEDLAARYGGEEFSIILPKARLDDALHVAEEIRALVAAKKVVNRRTGEALGQITLSIGVAEYRPGETPSDLIHRADEALYLAKKNGRDRVVSEALVTGNARGGPVKA